MTYHNLVNNIISSHETFISFIGETADDKIIGETADDKISQDFDKLVDNEEDPLEKEDKGRLAIVFKIFTYMLFIKIYIYSLILYYFIFQCTLFSTLFTLILLFLI